MLSIRLKLFYRKIFNQNIYSVTRSVMSSAAGPVEKSIYSSLNLFEPQHLEIINESHMHNVPASSETHFKVVVVSSKFDKLPLIKRHRMINEALKDQLSNGVHALSIIAKTPEQWEKSSQIIESSPACRGGFGK